MQWKITMINSATVTVMTCIMLTANVIIKKGFSLTFNGATSIFCFA